MKFSNPSLNLDDIPQHSSLELQQVHPTYKRIMLFERIILWMVITSGTFAVIIFKSGGGKQLWFSLGGIFSALLLGVLLFMANKAFQNMGYALRKHDLVFRKGWLFEKLHIVPLKKIQHCRVKQGPLERRYGLASIKIFTAGGHGADITLNGLTQQYADRLKDWLVISPVEQVNPAPEINATHLE